MSYPNRTGSAPGGQDPAFNPMSQDYPYGYQPEYGGYPDPATARYGAWSPRPPDHRALVIAALIGGVLFSLIVGMPLALIAQRNSRRVRGKWEAGDQAGAVKASRSARSWAIAAIACDVLGVLLFIVLTAHAGHPAS